MRIGIAQIDTTPGAFEQTVGHMVAQSQRAAEQGVELLVFPLAALAGIDAVPYADKVSFMRDVAEAVAQLSERLACPAIVPVPMDPDERGGFFDALLLESEGVRPLRMLSQLAPHASQPDRGDHEVTEFEFAGMRFALALSHAELDDLDDYDYDVDAIIFLSGYPYALDDPSSAMGADLEGARFVGDAQTTHAWLVGVAPVGGYGDQVFSGSSMVLAPSGELAALAPAFEEALVVADLAVPADERLADPLAPEVYDAPFHLWQAITLGLHDYVAKHGYTDVALCLDGTLGSCVLAALASDAVGPLHVHAVVGGSAGSRAAACRDLAHRLRIDVLNANGQLPGYDVRDLDELELATLAREHGALALSSLDKTALALGQHAAALNAAALCPLGDVYRSDVLDMAHVRNTISPLFRKVDLTDVDALDLPLGDGSVQVLATEPDITRVDEVLLGYVEYERSLAELVSEGPSDAAFITAVLRAERKAEPLRRIVPPVLAMSTHTLDDVRFPLGVRWHDEHVDDALDADGLFGQVDEQRRDHDGDARKDQSEGLDLDATLAMLRDLVEQGGFAPADLAPLTGDATLGGQTPGPPGWLTPFSEN